jgi:ribosomal protein S6
MILASEGSEVLEEKDWGKRRLAYEIEDFKEGFYNMMISSLILAKRWNSSVALLLSVLMRTIL